MKKVKRVRVCIHGLPKECVREFKARCEEVRMTYAAALTALALEYCRETQEFSIPLTAYDPPGTTWKDRRTSDGFQMFVVSSCPEHVWRCFRAKCSRAGMSCRQVFAGLVWQFARNKINLGGVKV